MGKALENLKKAIKINPPLFYLMIVYSVVLLLMIVWGVDQVVRYFSGR